MKTISLLAALVAASSGALGQTVAMQSQGGAEYACGGAGAEERAAIRALEAKANLALLFATAKRGGYLADVDVEVTDSASKSVVLNLNAEGPMCVLKLAAGSYRIRASYEGAARVRSITVPKDARAPLRIGFGFPEERWDGIRADPEEKRQARE